MLFYAVLAGFFAAIFAVFYQTLDESKPKWQLKDGLIGANPGLGFRPMPPESNVESTLVWFEAANEKNTEHWINALDEFLESKLNCSCPKSFDFIEILSSAYTTVNKEDEKNRKDCTPEMERNDGKVCRVDVTPTKFNICTKEQDYGYSKSSPCVFLKLNKVKTIFKIEVNQCFQFNQFF